MPEGLGGSWIMASGSTIWKGFRGLFGRRGVGGLRGSRDRFTKIPDRTVVEICRDVQLGEDARVHLEGGPAPEEFVDRLVRGKLYADAIRFLVCALPKREAVWWACLCVREVPACQSDDVSFRALGGAEAWVREPSEIHREAALAAGGKHRFEMPTAPAGWAAMAAGWSSGWHPALNETESVRGEQLTAHAASGAILLAAHAEPGRAAEMCRRFLETGIGIAQGKMEIAA